MSILHCLNNKNWHPILFFMSYETKAAILVEKGKYKKAVKLITRSIKTDAKNLHLYRLRFEYAQFIPFDKLYHEVTEEFFRILLDREVSGNIIHDHYSLYLSTTQGKIGLNDAILLELSAKFAGYGFVNDAVYIINRMIRKNVKPIGLIDAIVSLVNFYLDSNQQQKATQYVQYMIDFFPQSPMTKYLVQVYKQAE
ncbi:hypothetical protein MNBD_GAMMA01-652 [hydrothermal vent metagenome]|uniref:Uncharacterized protein n=1 Tax=hydrothermal vent metagenome TaxID=652676 RepID=A0A3B0URV5_9ZZZZ